MLKEYLQLRQGETGFKGRNQSIGKGRWRGRRKGEIRGMEGFGKK